MSHAPSLQRPPKSAARTIFNVTSGNFPEMCDFMVFGYYATAISKTFFPGDDPFASLMRLPGAIILGAYIDHHGRRKGLLLSLGLMAIGILTIALVPGYATLGVAAPILILLGRLLQGFSAGVELGGCRSIWRKWHLKAAKAFSSAGSQAVSRLR